MKPAPFEYLVAGSAEEALSALADIGDGARVLAGGQSLIPAMNFRLAQPAMLVDINGVSGLDFIQEARDGGVRFGAITRQRTVERSALVADRVPLLAEAMPWVAHPQIRNRGTIGGTLAHADPAAEVPAVMLALGARFRVMGPGGERWVAAEDFFTGLFATAVGPDELLVEIEVPPPAAGRTGYSFTEIARRQGDFALVGVAATVALDEAGNCADARVALISVSDGPVLAGQGAATLIGEAPGPESVRAAVAAAAEHDVDPPGDMHASAEYRRHLVEVMTRRALETAFARVMPEGAT